MEEKNFALGVVSAVAVIFIWSGFIVFSRMGVATALTPFDISALRFIVGAVAVAHRHAVDIEGAPEGRHPEAGPVARLLEHVDLAPLG
ncbi:MAG: hypothetical protein AAFU55_03270, partial [Pseudomonadota bacterium]